jgi:hypothetical protein
MKRPKILRGGTLCVVFVLLTASATRASDAPVKPGSVARYQPRYYPYREGERAVYRAHWNGLISVASAEVYTVPAVVDGRKVFQVRVEAKTSRILDLIWKMRDTITSTFETITLSPFHFNFSQRENSRVIDTDAHYNQTTKKWAVNRRQAGKRAKVYEFDSENTLDPITAVYLARSVDFKVGDRLFFKIFGGRYRYLLELSVEQKEPVGLESGKVIEAYRIVPRVQNLTKRGYAERFKEAAIWISADDKRLPIKMSSKILFGTVHLEIVEEKQGVQSSAAAPDRPPPS